MVWIEKNLYRFPHVLGFKIISNSPWAAPIYAD